MASITISSGYIDVPAEKRDNIFLTSANINYQCQAAWSNKSTSQDPPETSAGDHEWKTYSYSDLQYSWVFSPSGSSTSSSGSITITGLTAKEKNEISASLKVSGVETVTTYTRTDTSYDAYYDPPLPEQGEMTDEEYAALIAQGDYTFYPAGVATGETSSSISNNSVEQTENYKIDVYTRPGTFSDYNFTANTIIESQEGLTAQKVSNWITHCNAFNSWYNQSADTSANSCAVSTGDYITALWYNSCVNAIADVSLKPATVTGGTNGTVLTTTVFSALGTAISKGD